MRLAESKALVEELARERHVFFEDNLVTLHHTSYQKDLRKISLQFINVKGKNVTEKWGQKLK